MQSVDGCFVQQPSTFIFLSSLLFDRLFSFMYVHSCVRNRLLSLALRTRTWLAS